MQQISYFKILIKHYLCFDMCQAYILFWVSTVSYYVSDLSNTQEVFPILEIRIC